MKNFYYPQSKATICTNNTCVTVHGKAAKTIEVIAIGTAIVLSVAAIIKLLQ